MSCHQAKPSLAFRPLWPWALAITIGMLAAGRLALAGGQPDQAPKGTAWPRAMVPFMKLGPAERYRVIEKAGLGNLTTQKVKRGVLRLEIVERGTLEAARNSEVTCTLRARGKTPVATTIRWLIDNGSEVKKGDKLIALDDSGLRDELQQLRAIELAAAEAVRDKARNDLKLVRMENQIDIRLAEIEVQLAEKRLKRAAKDTDADQKEEMQLRVEQAQLHLKRVKAHAGVKEAAKLAKVRTQEAQVALEKSRISAVEAEMRKCVLRAPQDGVVLYYIPEGTRFSSSNRAPIVAQGEPVSEGQKLLVVADLSKMQVLARVHEAFVAHLREADPKDREQWQPAEIRVDAFPSRVLKGHVKRVATVADAVDWFASDVKLYRTVVAIDTPLEGLRPGMSAEVRILAEQTPGPVLQVPLQAVMAVGKKRFCFVVTNEKVEVRAVETALRNDLAVEIRSGLKEGERVILSPRRLVGRLGPWLEKRRQAALNQDRERLAVSILVSSVKPTEEEAGRRSWIANYDLTDQDHKRIAALPTVREAIPVRTFPQEARRLSRASNGMLVATTPEFAAIRGLALAEGRFLTATDGRNRRNVVVLGAIIADSLFPGEEPVGGTIVLNRSAYTVVGVLDEQNETAGGLSAWTTNRAIYLPLQTCQARFGKRVRIVRGASRTAEEVALHAILVTVRAASDVPATMEDIREILEQAHTKKDWSVQGLSSS